MARFKISGVWKNAKGEVTHYALHTVTENSATKAAKTSKEEVIQLLETTGNSAQTWIWNYRLTCWQWGENITVADGPDGKYLKSFPDNQTTDNLAHLIDLGWMVR